MNKILLIALGGAAGSVARYWMSTGVYVLLGRSFPYGTLAVNVIGSFLMGLLFVVSLDRFADISEQLRALLLIGFLGGFTTFSAFSLETLNLFESGETLHALYNIILSCVLCIAAVWTGVLLGRNI